MSLTQHLSELRVRLFRAGGSIVVGAVVGWFLAPAVLAALSGPLSALALKQSRVAGINYSEITSAFDLQLQIAVTVGLIIASPVWLFQLWAFFLPAMTRRERKFTLGFLGAAIPLFLLGCLSGLFVFPHVVTMLTSFAPQSTTSLISAKSYYDFILKLVIIVGVAFVLPVFLVLLNFVGVLAGMTLLRSWRIALIAIVLFTALATPSADVLSMFLLAIPMVALYFGAVLVSVLHDRSAARKIEESLVEA